MSSFVYRCRNAQSFTQLVLESFALNRRWARRLLGGKWERFPWGWLWVKEFGFDALGREEYVGWKLKKQATLVPTDFGKG